VKSSSWFALSVALALLIDTSLRAAVADDTTNKKPPCEWREATGEAVLENVSAEEARRLALNAARLRAVEGVAGVDVLGQTLVRDHALAAQFLLSLAQGQIVEEHVTWEPITLRPDPPVTAYRARLAACVAPPREPRDPYFVLTAELNKATYVAREPAEIRVRCAKDCYVSILNLIGRDEFTLLASGDFHRAGEEKRFPRDGIQLRIETPPGSARSTEAFLVVATKQPVDLVTLFAGRSPILFADVSRALLNLPASERAEALLVYEVRAR
jgi:uncharacterized protein DUF4384